MSLNKYSSIYLEIVYSTALFTVICLIKIYLNITYCKINDFISFL